MGTHKFKIDGKNFEVQVGTRLGSLVDVSVNGKAYSVEVEQTSSSAPPAVATAATSVATAPVATPPSPAPSPSGSGGPGDVRAPISGVVLSIEAKVGDKVEPTTKILVLEAMKMENEIFAATSGTISQIHVGPQQEVREGDLLVTIETD